LEKPEVKVRKGVENNLDEEVVKALDEMKSSATIRAIVELSKILW